MNGMDRCQQAVHRCDSASVRMIRLPLRSRRLCSQTGMERKNARGPAKCLKYDSCQFTKREWNEMSGETSPLGRSLSSEVISQKLDALRPDITCFLQKFVQHPSLPGKEQSVQSFISAKLQALGMDVSILESVRSELEAHPAFCDDNIAFCDRLNVVGRWPGSSHGESRTLILNGHVDVVPVGNETLWNYPPWSGVVEDGRLHGRGSCDMKSGITAAIFACQALKELGFNPAHSVTIETVIGEESGGIGTLTTLVKGVRAAAAIIMEPTKLQVCPVQSGALSFRIRVPGRAIHASMKIFGVSAIQNFYLIFNALEDLDRARHARYRNPLFEFPANVAPISVGTLRCGDWPSTVPDELIAEGRFGIFPGEPLAQARAEFEACIQACARTDEWLAKHPPAVEWFEGQFESSETSIDEPIAKTLLASHTAVTGSTPPVYGASYGSDQRLFTNNGQIPTVLYGPGDVALAHTVEEWVPLEQVFTCAKVLAQTVAAWCGS